MRKNQKLIAALAGFAALIALLEEGLIQGDEGEFGL